jgi:hypothetical protein
VPAAHERFEAALALATEQEFVDLVPFGMILHGWTLAAQGHDAEGIAQMRQGLAAQQAMRRILSLPLHLLLLAAAYGNS